MINKNDNVIIILIKIKNYFCRINKIILNIILDFILVYVKRIKYSLILRIISNKRLMILIILCRINIIILNIILDFSLCNNKE